MGGNLRGGNPLKKVTHGIFTTTWSSSEVTKDVTITAVGDINKCIERITSFNSASSAFSDNAFTIELVNTTTLRFTRTGTNNLGTVSIGYTVEEYRNVKSIVRTTKTYTNAAPQTDTISAVNTDKTLFAVSSRTASATNSGVSYLQDSTTVYFDTDGSTTTFIYIVLELY